VASAVFAGDRRVWRVAAIVALPFILLTAFYCLRPRPYFTGTNNVEDVGPVANVGPKTPACVPGLYLPAGTAAVRVQVFSRSARRPRLHLTLLVRGHLTHYTLAATNVRPLRASNADFVIPTTPSKPTARTASLCLTADGPVSIGGTTLSSSPLTVADTRAIGRVAVWFLPPRGRTSSLLARAWRIFHRAALFRPGAVNAWTFPLLLFVVLPALALLALRCLALAAAGRTRRIALTLYAVAALNACCWALITPVFQGPDEVDHFAYTQSLVERAAKPTDDPQSTQPPWSSAEKLAVKDTSFLTDHQVGDSRAPWLLRQVRAYEMEVQRLHPSRRDGGGYTTSATHGPSYYLALAPAYLLTRHASVFSQLTLMRICSALLGALVPLFTFLLARELAPQRPWLAVLAALLVAYEPMYGFISGIVNNDVGVNATAAALELLLIRLLRRGVTVPWAALTGAVLVFLPNVKGTGLSLYPVAGLVFVVGLWRYHRRGDLLGWAALALAAVLVAELATHVLSPAFAASAGAGGSATTIASNANAVSAALTNIPDFLSYLWQVFLPRLPFMTRHFPSSGGYPGYVIFIKRGWAAFGWYVVFFPTWVYAAIVAASASILLAAPLAVRRERRWLSRHLPEALAVTLMPVAVIVGFVAAYYTPTSRANIAEFGRYVFPAIGPIALLVVGALHAVGRRWALTAGVGLAVAIISLSYASQLLTLSAFYG
jgi:hypothetical protein